MKQDPKETLRKWRSATGRIARYFFIAAMVLLVLEIFLLIRHDRHMYFALDWGWGFYAALGFFGALVLIFLSGGLGSLLRQPVGDDSANELLPEDLDERLR